MQASLESESTRQKKQQEYGYKSTLGARAVSDEVHIFSDSEDGKIGVRWKGDKNAMSNSCEEKENLDLDIDGDSMRRAKTSTRSKTYCRRGSSIWRRRIAKRTRSDFQDDEMVLDDDVQKIKSSQKTADKESEESKESRKKHLSAYNLRDRSGIQKSKRSSSSIERCVPTVTVKKKPRKTGKRNKETMWWEKANAVRKPFVHPYLSPFALECFFPLRTNDCVDEERAERNGAIPVSLCCVLVCAQYIQQGKKVECERQRESSRPFPPFLSHIFNRRTTTMKHFREQ
jgi:hypothetical protein